MKIAICGLGYVGLSYAVMLAKKHSVVGYDVSSRKLASLRRKRSPIDDPDIRAELTSSILDFSVVDSIDLALPNTDYAIVATPTDYSDAARSLDTSSIEDTLDRISRISPKTVVVIKSTVPPGFMEAVSMKYPALDILYSPEFLREGHALYDLVNPSRIVVSGEKEKALKFGLVLKESGNNNNTPILVTTYSEAECIKLFSNSYLAMRVAFFNELDTYAYLHGISARRLIDGICLDPRIGSHYNNPSFGYGGYCLPKDLKALKANFHGVPSTLLAAIDSSNALRLDFVVSQIQAQDAKTIGFYRLGAKSNSSDFRNSMSNEVMQRVLASGISNVLLYEPEITTFPSSQVELAHSLADFKSKSDLIVANRVTPDLADVSEKVFSRDIFHTD